jgi:CBS domain-containing protein
MPDNSSKPAVTSKTDAYAYFGSSEGPMRSLPRRPPIIVPPETSVRNAMLQMNQLGNDSVVVVDDASKLPLGIVTQNDLVHAIAFRREDLEQPVAALMTAAPFTLPADAPAHRATVLMTQRKVSHVLLVESDGTLCNVVSRGDLFGLRGGGAETLAGTVTAAADVDTMAKAAESIRTRGAELFRAGMGAETLCLWMSALNDLVVMRVIELIENEFDLPAVPWCWLVFGSEGRLEQTFTTDQDNGLIFLPGDAADTDRLRAAFLAFGKAVNSGLDACGFDLCKGNIMAGNPAWCLSLDEWKRQYLSWMETPQPEAILNSTIFFDFRPLYGNYSLVDSLRKWLIPLPAQYPRFLRTMAEEALTCSPSLGWTGGFVYDGGRQHPHTIDLKLRGARPFVDAARIWSLTHGAWETNTGDRLRATAKAMELSPEETAAEVEAFYLVQRFRFQQQLAADTPEKANRLNPSSLNALNRLMLKEAFKQAKKLQLRLKLEHGF